MDEPTRADREAAARRYYLHGWEPNSALARWVEKGHPFTVQDKEVRAYAQGLADQREQHRRELADAEQAGYERGRRDALRRDHG